MHRLNTSRLNVFIGVRQGATKQHNFATHSRSCCHQFGRAFKDQTHFVLTRVRTSRLLANLATRRSELTSQLSSLEAGCRTRTAGQLGHRVSSAARGLATLRHHLSRTHTLATRNDIVPTTYTLFIRRQHRAICLATNTLPRCQTCRTPTLLIRRKVLHLYIGDARPQHFGVCNVANMFGSPSSRNHKMLRFGRKFGKRTRRLTKTFVLPADAVQCGLDRTTRAVGPLERTNQ